MKPLMLAVVAVFAVSALTPAAFASPRKTIELAAPHCNRHQRLCDNHCIPRRQTCHRGNFEYGARHPKTH